MKNENENLRKTKIESVFQRSRPEIILSDMLIQKVFGINLAVNRKTKQSITVVIDPLPFFALCQSFINAIH